MCIYIYTSAVRFLVGVQNSHCSLHRMPSVCSDRRWPPRQTPTVGLWSGRIGLASAGFISAGRYLNRPRCNPQWEGPKVVCFVMGDTQPRRLSNSRIPLLKSEHDFLVLKTVFSLFSHDGGIFCLATDPSTYEVWVASWVLFTIPSFLSHIKDGPYCPAIEMAL